MSAPPLALAAAAATLWGWQTGQWWVAVPAALLAESPRVFARRWQFALADYNRIADLCTVIAAVTAVILYVSFGNPAAIKRWFQWLPLVFMPVVLMHGFGAARELDLSVLFWSLRRFPIRNPIRFHPAWPWLALWLLGASAANSRDTAFYAGAAAIVLWALWSMRRKSSMAGWFASAAAAAALGYGAQIGLREVQLWVEGNVPELFLHAGTRTDPYESRTDIGRIGQLKGSAEIVLRVTTDAPLATPLLLHRASYDAYLANAWIARQRAFKAIEPSAPGVWRIRDEAGAATRITVHDQSSGRPVLSLPSGAQRLDLPGAASIQRNALGTVQAEIAPGRFRYEVQFRPGTADEAAPGADDLRLPQSEEKMLRAQLARFGLEGLAASDAVAHLKAQFASQFSYSSFQPSQAKDGTALAHFLDKTRAGHCEYFATATVLLLRAAGVPARYATGFSVMEYSTRDAAFVVRQRHAHAWARAYLEGAWRDVDTTPASWFEEEAGGDSLWTRAIDLWSSAVFAVRSSYDNLDRASGTAILLGVAALLIVWLGWRLFRGRTDRVQAAAGTRREGGVPRVGRDSAFYRLEVQLAARGLPRANAESLADWIARAERALPKEFDLLAARAALRLHYRLRFDPAGISAEERLALDGAVESLLRSINAA
ncbi:MAG: transglutaminase domain-containing protein [Pseudomonadota bacterium]